MLKVTHLWPTSTFLAAIFFLWSCGEKSDCEKAPDINHISVEWEFEDLITPMMEAESPEALWALIEQNPTYAHFFLDVGEYESQELAMQATFEMFNNVHFRDTLYAELKNIFPDFGLIKQDFDQAFRYFQHYFPGKHIPKIQLVMSGLRQDLFVSDSLILIGLDYFMGEKATYRPSGIPNYILNRYKPENMLPVTLLMFSQKFNKSDLNNQSLISEMVYFGKSLEFTKRLLPCTENHLIIGYTEEEFQNSKENEDIIWANFLQNDLLWETSHIMKNKFIGERPKTYEIGEKCPGRIGQWTGWQIVRQYLEKNEQISIEELMQQTDVEAIFHASRYKPKVNR